MSLSSIGREIQKKAVDIQVAVYAYLEFDVNDSTGTTKIEEIAKEINRLVRVLKREDAK